MTGSAADAEDLVQDAWIRYLDAGAPDVTSLGAYLTKTVSRLALDYLKSARVQREQYTGAWMPEPVLTGDVIQGPSEAVEQRESISIALLMLMEELSPDQRVIYVLREGFGLPFDEIGEHLDKSAATCRQAYRRAKAKIDSSHQPAIAPGPEHTDLVNRFLAAFAAGNVPDVERLLAADATWFGDGGPERRAIRRPVTGSERISRGIVAAAIKFRPPTPIETRILDINGAPAIAFLSEGRLDSVTALDIRNGKIIAVRSMRNLHKLGHLAASIGLEVVVPA